MVKNLRIKLAMYMNQNKTISAVEIKTENMQIPETVEGNKSPTTNGMGYIFYTISPVGEAFIKEECKPGKKVIEVGAGYNNIPIQALKNGVGEYTANDLSLEHLKILVHRVKDSLDEAALKRLRILPGRAPAELPKAEAQYDAILADKVIHFLPPNEINEFMRWVKAALKVGGKLYITMASPYSKLYNEHMVAKYLEQLNAGYEFPGHIKNMMDYAVVESKNYPKFKVPDEMVLFARQDLLKLLERYNMKPLYSASFKIPMEGQQVWELCADEESNVVGLIAAT